MIINYLKIALRNFFRSGTTSFINFFGLTVGVVSSILIFLYVHQELSYDRFHSKSENIFRVLSIDKAFGVSNNNVGITIPALAPAMKKEIPGVDEIVRIAYSGMSLVRYEENALYSENLFYTEPSFLTLFDFRLIDGNPENCLQKPNTALLSQSMAEKIFGKTNPMGKVFSADGNENLEVSGILEDEDRPGHFNFDIIISINPSPGDTNFIEYLNSWTNISMVEYVLLSHPENADQIIIEMDSLLRRNGVMDAWNATLQPLHDVHLHSEDILFDRFNENKGNISYVRSLSFIAIVILLIASFNYMNLSTARASRRAKEVGVRKTMGAFKLQLVGQHFTEALIQVMASVLIAFLIIELINIRFHVVSSTIYAFVFENPISFIYLVGLITGLALLSGFYPAMVLSSFNPQRVLKGETASGMRGGWLRRSLVIMQFIATFTMIVVTIIVMKQLHYSLKKDKGFNPDQIITIRLDNQQVRSQFDALKSGLESIPGVLSVATSGSMPGFGFGRTGIRPEGSSEEDSWIVSVVSADDQYIDLMDMQLLEGENFRKDMSEDPAPVIVNQSLVEAIGWDSGINRSIGLGGDRQATIIGVLKDFHFTSMRHKIEPIMIMYRSGANSILSVRVEMSSISEVLESIEILWNEINEGIPFEFQFFDESFGALFDKEADFSKMFFRFTLLSIIIAILGLYGLAAFTAEQRTKEIGIRKTFGASIFQMIFMQYHEFARLILLAFVISLPIAIWIVGQWLQNFEYRIEAGILPYIYSAVIVLIVTSITVGFHALGTALKNPSDTLRYE